MKSNGCRSYTLKSGGRNNHGRITVWHRGGGHKRLYRMVDFQRRLRDVTGTVRRIEYDPNRTTRIALVDFEAGIVRERERRTRHASSFTRPACFKSICGNHHSPSFFFFSFLMCKSSLHHPVCYVHTLLLHVDAMTDGPCHEGDANKPAYVLAVDGMKAGDTLTAGESDVDIQPGNAMPLGSMPAGTLIHNIELRPGQGGKLVRAAGATATLVKKAGSSYSHT